MAFTSTDLDAVDAAIKSGALAVSYGERRVQYRSMDELIAARDLIRRELDRASDTRRPRLMRTTVRKGV